MRRLARKEFHYVAYVLGLKDNLLCVYHCAAFDSLVSETLQREFINCLGIRVTRVLLRTGNLLVRLTMF